MSDHLPRRAALLLFTIVVLVWGANWAVTKVIVQAVPPLWATAIRAAIASAVLPPLLLWRGELIVPRRGDVPVILAIALLHMVAFSALVAAGLRHVPVGRSIVLGYTTPLWVAPGAVLLLGEAMPRRRLAGIAVGLGGLLLMFNPQAFDWHDRAALAGNGMVLLASLCWAASILYVRVHRWIATPFQLVFWQTLLAAAVLATLAAAIEGAPRIAWTPPLAAALAYGGVCGTALAYWAMATINRSLPASTTALGMLATPVAGVACSAAMLGERPDGTLLLAMGVILAGIALGTVGPAASRRGARSA